MTAPAFCAAFRGDDPDCLVAAALACPACLRDPRWELRLEPFDARAECDCGHCGTRYAVYLMADQALRLSLTRSGIGDPAAARA